MRWPIGILSYRRTYLTIADHASCSLCIRCTLLSNDKGAARTSPNFRSRYADKIQGKEFRCIKRSLRLHVRTVNKNNFTFVRRASGKLRVNTLKGWELTVWAEWAVMVECCVDYSRFAKSADRRQVLFTSAKYRTGELSVLNAISPKGGKILRGRQKALFFFSCFTGSCEKNLAC